MSLDTELPSDGSELSDEDFMNQSDSIENEIEKVISGEEGSNEDESEEVEAQAEEVKATDQPDELETTKGQDTTEKVEPEADVSDSANITKEDQLDAIYAPFKANGVDISVTSPKEAIRLMQQGAGASKRMQDLAPKLKILQMLENNDLLSEDRINELIAVGSKDPKAIAAFLKQAEIDPFTLELDQEDYQQQDHRVSDQEYKIKEVLETLSHQPKYQETLDTADSWDEESRTMAMKDPSILTDINGHIQSGIYDQIDTIIKQETIKGNLAQNTPYLDAYKYVGNQLQEAGAFDQGGSGSGDDSSLDGEGATPNNKGNNQLNSRRKAAVSTKSTSPNTKPKAKEDSQDLYKMSDEDFLKEYQGEEWMNPI